MRTTVTLENDVARQLREAAHRQGRSFKAVLNEAVRAGLHKPVARAKKITLPSYPMGALPGVDLTKANALAAELENQEIFRKLELGK
ncbi:MAG TPA: hypothetical protein VHC95_05755 [Opitutales bacterium]|nr:hypothetical protein [Opitutales bacterium]